MAIDLADAVVCVTGGARGIGRAAAAAFASRGARVLIGDIDVDVAHASALALGARVSATHLDVTDPRSFEAFIETARGMGPVDVLVNNAGIMRTGALATQGVEAMHRELAINLGGVVTGMRLVLDAMIARDRGHIVNVASMAGKMTVPGAAVYSASKHGVVALSRAVRAELAGTQVTVTTVLPAAVRTELTAGLDTRGVPMVDPEDVAEAIVASCAHGRAEVTLPFWVSPVGTLEQVLPEVMGEWIKRFVGAERRVTADNPERRGYRART